MINVPPKISKYLSNEYLTDRSNCEIAIDKLIKYYEYEQYQIPRDKINNIIMILEDQDELSPELIDSTLFLLDMILESFTSNIELTVIELSIIHKYFYHQGNHAINILTHAIRLNPSCSKIILKLFSPSKKYEGFIDEVINIFSHNFSESLFPILNLVYYLSDKSEIALKLTDIYQSLISIIPSLDCSEQTISFKILQNFCKLGKSYISILYNNDSVENLYSEIKAENDKECLNMAFEFLNFISNESEQSLDLIKRLKIQPAVKFAVSNLRSKAIKEISIIFYDVLIDDNEAVNYILENDFLNLFLSLESMVSFSVWQEVMTMVCTVVYASDDHQMEYIIENSDTIKLISQIAKNVDNEFDSSQKFISKAITYALDHLFEIAQYEFERNMRIIISQEILDLMEESAMSELGDSYHPITNFIESINDLYGSDIDSNP